MLISINDVKNLENAILILNFDAEFHLSSKFTPKQKVE